MTSHVGDRITFTCLYRFQNSKNTIVKRDNICPLLYRVTLLLRYTNIEHVRT